MVGLVFLVFAGYGLLAPRVGWADSCPIATLLDYIDLGSTGCTISDKLFNNFAFTANSTNATSPTPSSITVTPDPGSSLGPGFKLTGSWSVTTDGSLNSSITDVLDYDVSVTGAGLIEDASAALITPSASGGSSHVGYLLTNVTNFNLTLSVSTPSGDATFLPVSGMFVHTQIDVAALFGASSSASLSGVTNNFSETSPVPEPATLTLMAPGVMGVAWLRRRRRIGSRH